MNEKKIFPDQEFSQQAYISSIDEYQKLYRQSVQDPKAFWSQIARDDFYWEKDFAETLQFNYDLNKGPISIEW